jgi:hypothetical protein
MTRNLSIKQHGSNFLKIKKASRQNNHLMKFLKTLTYRTLGHNSQKAKKIDL